MTVPPSFEKSVIGDPLGVDASVGIKWFLPEIHSKGIASAINGDREVLKR